MKEEETERKKQNAELNVLFVQTHMEHSTGFMSQKQSVLPPSTAGMPGR